MRTLIWFGICQIIDAINNDKFMKEIDSATFILGICIAFDVICYYREKKRHSDLLKVLRESKQVKAETRDILRKLKTNSFEIVEKLEEIKKL